MTGRANWIARFSIALFSVLACIGITEFAMSVDFPNDRSKEYDPLLGWRNKPLREFAGGRINAQGLRDDHEFPPEPPAHVLRVAFVGDSFTFGYSADGRVQTADTFVKRFDAKLSPKVEAMNWGVSAYGIDQALLTLERDVLPTKPRLIVFSIIYDMILRSARDRYMLNYPHPGIAKPRFVLDGDELRLTSQLPLRKLDTRPSGSWILWAIESIRGHGHHYPEEFHLDQRGFDERWSLAKALLLRAAKDARQAGIDIAVVLLPTGSTLGFKDSRYRPDEIGLEKRIGELQQAGVAVLDLHSAFRRKLASSQEALFLPYPDCHPSAAGHRLIADELALFLAQRFPDLFAK